MEELTQWEIDELVRKRKKARRKWVEGFLSNMARFHDVYDAWDEFQELRRAFKLNKDTVGSLREGIRWSVERENKKPRTQF